MPFTTGPYPQPEKYSDSSRDKFGDRGHFSWKERLTYSVKKNVRLEILNRNRGQRMEGVWTSLDSERKRETGRNLIKGRRYDQRSMFPFVDT